MATPSRTRPGAGHRPWAVLARAGEATRIDLFDTEGRRTGYAAVDRDSGRVDLL